MNEMKPEDVMRALEKIVSDPNCTNMRYIEGCGYFCKVLREPIDDMARGRSTKCNENCEHYSQPYIEGLIRSALALLREKDGEIERLIKERDEARRDVGVAERNHYKSEKEIEGLKEDVELCRHTIANLSKMLDRARPKAAAEFAVKLKAALIRGGIYPAFVSNQIEKILKEMTEDT